MKKYLAILIAVSIIAVSAFSYGAYGATASGGSSGGGASSGGGGSAGGGGASSESGTESDEEAAKALYDLLNSIQEESCTISGNTVTLERRFRISEPIEIPEGGEIILELSANISGLNGTHAVKVPEGAILTIRDNGTITGGDGEENKDHNVGGSAIVNYGTLTIEDGRFYGGDGSDTSLFNQGGTAIINYGTLTVSDGNIYGGEGQYDGRDIPSPSGNEITHGMYGGNGIYNLGTLTVNGGRIEGGDGETNGGNGIVNGYDTGIFTMTYGDVNGGESNNNGGDGSLYGGSAVINYEEMTIEGGSLRGGNGREALINNGNGSVVSAGIDSGENSSAVENKQNGILSIEDCNIYADGNGIGIINMGELTVKDSRVNGGRGTEGGTACGDGIMNDGTLKLINSQIEAGYDSSSNLPGGNGITNYGTVNTDGGSITGGDSPEDSSYPGHGIENNGYLTIKGTEIHGGCSRNSNAKGGCGIKNTYTLLIIDGEIFGGESYENGYSYYGKAIDGTFSAEENTYIIGSDSEYDVKEVEGSSFEGYYLKFTNQSGTVKLAKTINDIQPDSCTYNGNELTVSCDINYDGVITIPSTDEEIILYLGNYSFPSILVPTNAVITINGGRITGKEWDGNEENPTAGNAVENYGVLTLNSSKLIGGDAQRATAGNGGHGIYNAGTLKVSNAYSTGGSASGTNGRSGDGIKSTGGSVTVWDSKIKGGSASQTAGNGLNFTNTTANLYGGTYTGGEAFINGGTAVANLNSQITVHEDVEFKGGCIDSKKYSKALEGTVILDEDVCIIECNHKESYAKNLGNTSTKSFLRFAKNTPALDLMLIIDQSNHDMCYSHGDTVTLKGNITLTEILQIPAGNKINLELNNFNITAAEENSGISIPDDAIFVIYGNGKIYGGKGEAEGKPAIVNSGNLTIERNAEIIGGSGTAAGSAIENTGTLILNYCTLKSGNDGASSVPALIGSITSGNAVREKVGDNMEIIQKSTSNSNYISAEHGYGFERLMTNLNIIQPNSCIYDLYTDEIRLTKTVTLSRDLTIDECGAFNLDGFGINAPDEYAVNIYESLVYGGSISGNVVTHGMTELYDVDITGLLKNSSHDLWLTECNFNGLIYNYSPNSIIEIMGGSIKGYENAETTIRNEGTIYLSDGVVINGCYGLEKGGYAIKNGIQARLIINGAKIYGGNSASTGQGAIYAEYIHQGIGSGGDGSSVQSIAAGGSSGSEGGSAGSNGEGGSNESTDNKTENDLPEINEKHITVIFNEGQITGGAGPDGNGVAIWGYVKKDDGITISESDDDRIYDILFGYSSDKRYLKASNCLSVTNVEKTDDKYNLKINCSVELDEDEKLLVAVYDGQGNMVEMKEIKCDGSMNYDTDFDNDTEIKDAKVFVWLGGDSMNLRPVSGNEEIPLD